MPSWLLKAAVQGTISVLPGRLRLNAVLQRRVTGSLALGEAMFETKISHCRHHIEAYRNVTGADRPPRTALELGTGWYPVVPVGLALCGVERVMTIDVSVLLHPQRVRQVLERYAAAIESGALDRALPQLHGARVEQLLETFADNRALTAPELLERVGVRALVGDARIPRLPAASAELVVSNNTLEHIPTPALSEILIEFRRIAAVGAVMDHFIDLSDHYAHFDDSITEFNYMRFSPGAWRAFNNALQYQNRLRAPDYRELIEAAGFRMAAEQPERGDPGQLARVRLAAPFRRYTEEDLLVLRAWFTAAPAPR